MVCIYRMNMSQFRPVVVVEFHGFCVFMFSTVAEPQMVTSACSCFSQLKSAALRGERYRVIGERGGPAGMWRLEGGKWGLSSSHPDITGRWYPADFGCFFFGFAHLRTIPKTHVKEGGWKWVESSETWRPTLGYNVWWLTISGLGRARAGGKVGEATACGHCPRTDFHT